MYVFTYLRILDVFYMKSTNVLKLSWRNKVPLKWAR